MYYTKSQSHSKEEIAALLADYRTEYADIKELPRYFPPCAHEHKMLDNTDFPVNQPANGGRADTETRLQAARRIGLSVFDGTKDIALVTPGNWIIVTPIYTGASGSFNAKKHHYATILPAGGTWAYYCLAFGAGVAGGGATVATVTIGSEQTLQQTWNTLCWRIA